MTNAEDVPLTEDKPEADVAEQQMVASQRRCK